MQGDLSELRRDVTGVRQTLAEHTQKLDELEIYTAYETGLGTQNKADLQAIKKTIKAMEERLNAIEAQP
jgi:septal ring factor EnvC (AmiA/AmiB activator)